jgi:hypothetical protein
MLSRDASLAGRKESIAAAREASSGATKHTLGLTAHHAETHFVNLEAVIREIDGTLSMIVVSVMPPHSTAEQSRAEHCTALHCAVWLAMNAAAGTQHSTAPRHSAVRSVCAEGRKAALMTFCLLSVYICGPAGTTEWYDEAADAAQAW